MPLIKKDGTFVESTCDEALSLVASTFKATQDTYGPNSVAFLASARTTNEENYLMNKLARTGFHTNYLDHCARLCHGPTVSGLARSFGSRAMTNSNADIAEANCIFIIGSNTMEQHPLIGRSVIRAKEKGAPSIISDTPLVFLSVLQFKGVVVDRTQMRQKIERHVNCFSFG